jgi:hypothetical protein
VTDYSRPLESLPEPYQRIYEAIYQAAHLGIPCPSNRDLAAISGWPDATPRYATQAVNAIAVAGLIRVERGLTSRVVVLPSGQSTAGTVELPRALTGNSLGLGKGPPVPNTPRIERTICFRCGARSDRGCPHLGYPEAAAA